MNRLLPASGDMCRYLSVVVTEAWPNDCCSNLKLQPASKLWLAWLCLSQCAEVRLSIFALLQARLSILCTTERSIWFPFRLINIHWWVWFNCSNLFSRTYNQLGTMTNLVLLPLPNTVNFPPSLWDLRSFQVNPQTGLCIATEQFWSVRKFSQTKID